MAKYYRLKDKGATFYDHAQGKGLVADRIGKFESSAQIIAAVKGNVIEEVKDRDVEAKYNAQEEKLADNRKTQKKAVELRNAGATHVTVKLDKDGNEVARELGKPEATITPAVKSEGEETGDEDLTDAQKEEAAAVKEAGSKKTLDDLDEDKTGSKKKK